MKTKKITENKYHTVEHYCIDCKRKIYNERVQTLQTPRIVQSFDEHCGCINRIESEKQKRGEFK